MLVYLPLFCPRVPRSPLPPTTSQRLSTDERDVDASDAIRGMRNIISAEPRRRGALLRTPCRRGGARLVADGRAVRPSFASRGVSHAHVYTGRIQFARLLKSIDWSYTSRACPHSRLRVLDHSKNVVKRTGTQIRSEPTFEHAPHDAVTKDATLVFAHLQRGGANARRSSPVVETRAAVPSAGRVQGGRTGSTWFADLLTNESAACFTIGCRHGACGVQQLPARQPHLKLYEGH